MGALHADAGARRASAPIASWYCGCCGLVRPADADGVTPGDAPLDASC